MVKNIYLVGMPGSGKSTLGRRIADKLNRKFMDTDEEIKMNVQVTPEEIIAYQGEEKLRELEKALLRKLLSTSGLIVSTGGGFPVYNDNMKLMKEDGITVYLHYDARTLWKRLEHDRIRPLSSSLKTTENLLSRRSDVYGEAQIIIRGEEDMERNLELIMNSIREKFPEEL